MVVKAKTEQTFSKKVLVRINGLKWIDISVSFRGPS